MNHWTDRLLDSFDAWFCSKAGVYQTLIVTMAIVALALAIPGLDPHLFWVMAGLTVYSAITQPALAHTAHTGAYRLEGLMSTVEALIDQHAALLAAMRAQQEQDTEKLEQIELGVEQLVALEEEDG